MLNQIYVERACWSFHTLYCFSLKLIIYKLRYTKCGIIMHQNTRIQNFYSTKWNLSISSVNNIKIIASQNFELCVLLFWWALIIRHWLPVSMAAIVVILPWMTSCTRNRSHTLEIMLFDTPNDFATPCFRKPGKGF